MSLPPRAHASHIYVVVLSYRMGAEINAAVYGALIRDLKRHGRPATVVACISDPVDFEVLETFRDLGNVRLMLLHCVLRRGWKLIYVPDVAVHCLEKQPRQGFCDSTIALVFRYFGNMARNNARALRLGPRRVGWFTWLVSLNHRLSPWTSLWGPASAVALAVLYDNRVLAIYLCWVLLTRTAQCAIFGLFRLTFHPLFPFLQFYNQIVGAALKVAVFFNPDKQSWTRQLTGRMTARHHASSAVLMWLSLLLLTTTAVVVSTL